MTGVQRACWWGLGGLGAAVSVGLAVWVTATHPEGSGQAWGAVGAVAGVAAVVAALWQLRVSASAAAAPSLAGSMRGDSGAIVTDGSVANSSTSVTGTPSVVPTQVPSGRSGSTGAIVAGGNVEGSNTSYQA